MNRLSCKDALTLFLPRLIPPGQCPDLESAKSDCCIQGGPQRESLGLCFPCIRANESLERDVADLLRRPLGRPSHKPVVRYKSFLYQAESWKTARHVVAKVEFHWGELFPRVGFIVTNLETDGRAVVRFYNKRGTAEQWIKEGK